jgi:AraC-like DNA-binding protein
MDDLFTEEDVEALAGAYWDNPVSSVLSCYFPSLSDPWRAETKADAPQPDGVSISLLLQREGHGVFVSPQGDRRLEAGDITVYLEDASNSAPEAGQILCRFKPGALETECLSRLPAVFPRTERATALLGHFGLFLHEFAEALPATLRARFLDRLLEMLCDLLPEPAEPDAAPAMPLQVRVQLEGMKAHMEAHLKKPDFTVNQLAAELGVSLSQIHRVFAHSGVTASAWLWNRRLEGCADDLHDVAAARRSMGDIALSWGFNDLSHFSHAFKKRFGTSPKEWRKRAPWRKPLAP